MVVEVERCGICGTDLHVVDGDAPSLAYPVIPGHEFSAHVVALGAGVTHLAPGTFVVVDPMVFCGHCVQCRRGWTNLCPNGGGLGTTADGAFARYVRAQADQCEPVPESVPAAWAPLTEPLSCVLHALDRIGPVLGTDTLVIGAGPAGLMLTRMLCLGGARVDVVERRPERLARPRRSGPTGRPPVPTNWTASAVGGSWSTPRGTPPPSRKACRSCAEPGRSPCSGSPMRPRKSRFPLTTSSSGS